MRYVKTVEAVRGSDILYGPAKDLPDWAIRMVETGRIRVQNGVLFCRFFGGIEGACESQYILNDDGFPKVMSAADFEKDYAEVGE